MFKKSKAGFYFFEEFSKIDGVIHGFSTRKFGDMNIKSANSDDHLKVFLTTVGINNKNIVRMNQVHGSNVEVVSHRDFRFSHSGNQVNPEHPESDSGQAVRRPELTAEWARMTTMDNADGLISSSERVCLVGTFADCVPILFLDKGKKIFGIAHAGWKGVYKEIVKILVSKMSDRGCDPKNILVGLGPSIRVCCYNIDEDRAQLFMKKFPKWQKKILQKKDNLTFLDLQTIIKLELLESGILKANIKDCMVCTKDNMSDFYSYRGEHSKGSFGLFAAVIGRI